ncbi:MAG: GNAT family N-acetyltransferase [bacterium]|nr:GNAT family N-acetyltransferase [bacterium]
MEQEEAERVVRFLSSKRAFSLEITSFRVNARKEAVMDSLSNPKHKYWYVYNSINEVIAAGGVNENERNNGGFYLDYFAVHEDLLRQGLGNLILQEAEKFVKSVNGRFILIGTGSTDEFAAASKFYENCGYTQVSKIPNYYEIGDDRIDYYKKL